MGGALISCMSGVVRPIKVTWLEYNKSNSGGGGGDVLVSCVVVVVSLQTRATIGVYLFLAKNVSE